MTADFFRKLVRYHLAANRHIWDEWIAPLSDDQFVTACDYSVGSVRNQCVHLFNIDERWLCGLRGLEIVNFEDPDHYGTDKEKVRTAWDDVARDVEAYIAALTDEDLEKPYAETGLTVAEVLFHMVNHGTDHRAQLLRVLHDLGVETKAQDYVYFAWGHWPAT